MKRHPFPVQLALPLDYSASAPGDLPQNLERSKRPRSRLLQGRLEPNLAMLGRPDTVPGSFWENSDLNYFRQGQRFELTPLLSTLINEVNGKRWSHGSSRDLDCQYKTAFVMAHKIREAMASEASGQTVAGTVEVDGGYFGGHIRPANNRINRVDRRLAEHQTGKRRVVVVMRERGGRTLPFVFRSEDASLPMIVSRVARQAASFMPTKLSIGTRYMRAS